MRVNSRRLGYGNGMQHLEDLPKKIQDLTKSIEAGIIILP